MPSDDNKLHGLSDNAYLQLLDFAIVLSKAKQFSNRELVQEVLKTPAVEYPLVQEMMTRLDPDWNKQNPL